MSLSNFQWIALVGVVFGFMSGGREAIGMSELTDSVAYVNGNIYTSEGFKSAMLVSSGIVESTGTDEQIRKLADQKNVVDLQGRTLFPGLADLHVHPGYGAKFLKSCDVPSDVTAEELARLVGECAAKVKPGDWIYGSGWDAASVHSKKFTRQILDKVAPANPVVIADKSGHDAVVNTLALKAAGFTATTPEMPGGRIEREASNEPTGMLREAPAAKLRYAMPPTSDDEAKRLLESALTLLSSYGVTSFVDAGIRLYDAKAYAALADEGKLHQRVRGCILWNMESPDFDQIYRDRAKYERDNFKLDCVKVFMDGTPNESHSAAMLDPYEGAHGCCGNTAGQLSVDPQELKRRVTEWDKAGMIVKFHSGGDKAVQTALDAIQEARRVNGSDGPRHEIAHVVFITDDDLVRSKVLNAVLEFSPALWYPNPISEGIARATGKRSEHIWPVKKALETGNFVTVGTDWPGAADLNPWLAIETLVTRQQAGATGGTLGGKEAISLEQAIEIFTKNASQTMRGLEFSSFLVKGDPADFIVIDANPFAAKIGEIHSIKTLKTYISGKEIFDFTR